MVGLEFGDYTTIPMSIVLAVSITHELTPHLHHTFPWHEIRSLQYCNHHYTTMVGLELRDYIYHYTNVYSACSVNACSVDYHKLTSHLHYTWDKIRSLQYYNHHYKTMVGLEFRI